MESIPKHSTKVAIVLLSYNSLKLVKQFLPLIIQSTPKSEKYKIYLVDNASTDGTYEYVKGNFPQVHLIRLNVNKGFTNGYVASLSQIDAEYYVLISSDVEVSENWLEAPLSVLEKNQDVAAVQPKIMSYHMREKLEYAGAAGGFIDYLGYPFCRGRIVNVLEEDKKQYDDAIQTFWASGACLFIRADLYHKAGGLDNDFFAHMEEIDLCWRLQNMGYKIMVAPTAIVYHMGGYIISYGSPQKVFRNHRNNLIMLLKNLAFSEVLWKIPMRFILDALTFYKMVFDGELKPALGIVKAHWQFIIYFPKWWKKRLVTNKLIQERSKYGIYPKSIVWQFFIKKKQSFDALQWKP